MGPYYSKLTNNNFITGINTSSFSFGINNPDQTGTLNCWLTRNGPSYNSSTGVLSVTQASIRIQILGSSGAQYVNNYRYPTYLIYGYYF